MRSFELLVQPEHSSSSSPFPAGSLEPSPPRSGRRVKTNEVLDMFVQGARASERHASTVAGVLRDLAWALAELAPAARGKRIVRFEDDAWELCVERLGVDATLSVYRGGADPTVIVYDRLVVFEEMCASVLDAVDGALEHGRPTDLVVARHALVAARAGAVEITEVAPESEIVTIEIDRDVPIAFAVEFQMRAGASEAASPPEPSVERADLHALLVKGRMRAEIRGRQLELGEVFPFLFAERVLDLARRALDAWERGQPFFARLDAGGVMVGVRTSADEAPPSEDRRPPASHPQATALTMTPVSASEPSGRAPVSTFPELSLFDLVEAALAFGRALVRAVLRRDRAQAGNLRLAAFRRDLRALSDALREVRRNDERTNPAPESYRAFAKQLRPRTLGERGLSAARLRYAQRWRALVPGIDLRATFLCGERIVIGAAAETFCLDRTSGELIWRCATPRAASVVTPAGIARIGTDGAIALHDFASGEITLRAWIAPRLGGTCAGAVVNTPSLPRLLVLTEGERHLVAIDLGSGEARWRYACGRGGAARLKRVGKLLYVVCGDSSLTAVDVQTGAVVWRVRDRLRFHAPPTADHDSLVAVAGGSGSAASLYSVDPYSGHVLWTARVPASPCTVEGGALLAPASVCVAIRDRRGLRLAGFDRDSGAPLFHTEPLAPVGTSWLVVDDLLVGNAPNGELLAVDAATGALRWRQTLGKSLDTDVPRRLEPVLRSGALFVPHADVHVVRPSDGEHLGTVGPCDAIPDLLRVDERCDVYVAEESGHMAAFGAGPRLTLVK